MKPPTRPWTDLLSAIQRRVRRRDQARGDDAARTIAALGRVGVLGWLIVAPTLLGTWAGHTLDRVLGTGIFWTAPLLLVGLALGCWSGWRWMQRT
jgi:ATP synthase protein I